MIVARVWTHISTMRYYLLPPLQTFTSLVSFSFDQWKTWPIISLEWNIVSCFVIAPCVELLFCIVNIDGLGFKRILTAIVIFILYPFTEQVPYLLVSCQLFIVATQVNIMVVIICIVWNIPPIHSQILPIGFFLSIFILFVLLFNRFYEQICYIADSKNHEDNKLVSKLLKRRFLSLPFFVCGLLFTILHDLLILIVLPIRL